ncbi:MAG TPA: MFS transporter [Pseudolabrys sp.]|nr:MFS transporter [Pseudolabrys sp.]
MTTVEKISGSASAGSDRSREVRRVAMASLVGTTIEWYDFLIYATMAGAIFNQYFFPKGDEFVNTMLAYGTFAAGFLIRPFGGLLFGHFGDRIGRKPLLVLTLMIMGLATFLIGLLPTYAQVGIWSPILLLALRLIQGVALGGEWGGAVLMSYEFARPEEKAYYASFPQFGLAIGLCCSTGVVTFLSYALSNQDFVSWGWRVAFMLSILLLAVGLFIRLRVLETPEFEKQARREVARVPMWEVLRDYPGTVVLGWGARLIDGIIFTIYAIFPLSYLTTVAKIPRTTVLAGITIAAFVLIFTIPYSSKLADRVGRKKLYIMFSLICGFATIPALWVMQYSGSPILACAMIVLLLGVLYAPVYGPQAAIFCDLFDTRVRYTGVSLIYQIGAIFSVSLTPLAATALLHANNNQPWLIAGYVAAAGVISAICVAAMKRVP